VRLRVTPCDECGAMPVCRLTRSRGDLANILSSFSPFFEKKEAHLSFNCKHFVPKPREVGK